MISSIVENFLRKSIDNYFKDWKYDKFTPLDLIFPKERIITSAIQGLATSLGTKLWENIAIELAKKNGFVNMEATKFNKAVPVIPDLIRNKLSKFESEKTRNYKMEFDSFFEEIKNEIQKEKITSTGIEKMPKGMGADLWLKKNNTEYLIDIKTVKINAGDGNKYNKTLLQWYTYCALQNKESVKCLIAFPYNPYEKQDYWIKEGGKVKPLIPEKEAVVADQFWDFISGEKNTTQQILDAFKKLRDENIGKKYIKKFT